MSLDKWCNYNVYQSRYQRDCLGGLVQIDGFPHDWLEGRAPKCCLLVCIDDATGRLTHLRFGETESAFDYMMATVNILSNTANPWRFTVISKVFSGSIMVVPPRSVLRNLAEYFLNSGSD